MPRLTDPVVKEPKPPEPLTLPPSTERKSPRVSVPVQQQYQQKNLQRIQRSELLNVAEPGFGTSYRSTLITSIQEIEKATNGKLPTDLVIGLQRSNLSDPDIRRLAVTAARYGDIPPQFLWDPKARIKHMTDPLYGGPMRFSTVYRLTEGLEPAVLSAM